MNTKETLNRFPANRAFNREADSEDQNLLQQGEQIYHHLKENPDEVLNGLHAYVVDIHRSIEILINNNDFLKQEKSLHQTRIILNGIMDAAGENQDIELCLETKDILELFFGLHD